MDDVRRQLQMKENKKSKKRRIFQVFLLMICSAILYVSYAAYDIWSYRFKTDDSVKTDAGIVLGAASWNGKPSPVFKERINHAISLYKNGNIKRLFYRWHKVRGRARGSTYCKSICNETRCKRGRYFN